MDTENYNLVDEPWIPVLFNNGDFKRVSIKNALLKAHEIRQIAASNPMDRVSIFRFLLAVLYWCRGNPEENQTIPEKFPEEWLAKLDDNKDCFNLFGEGKRFYQDIKAKEDKEFRPITDLIHEIPTETNIAHFRHADDFNTGLCPACCALGLLRLPVFTTMGGKGKSPGINKTPPIYFLPNKHTLHESLWNSYKTCTNLGEPTFDRLEMKISEKGNISLLEGLTDLPRKVWLKKPKDEGSCIYCGQKKPLIKRCVFKGITKLKENDDTNWVDPHVVKKDNKNFNADNTLKIWFKTDRPWSRLALILRDSNIVNNKYFIAGFATHQVKFIDIWERDVLLKDERLLQGDIDLKNYDDNIKKLPSKIKDFRRGKYSVNDYSIYKQVIPQIENFLSTHLSEIINNENKISDLANSIVAKMMVSISESLISGYTCSEVKRKSDILRVVPYEDKQEKNTKKKVKSKKGDK